MKLSTTAALITTALALSACSDESIERTIATLTGELQALTTDKATLQARLDSETALTDAQRQALQSRLDAVEDRLASLEPVAAVTAPPETPAPPPVAAVPEAAPAPPHVPSWADMECRPRFRAEANPCNLPGEYDYNAYSSAN